jgi:hypothetical protein
MRVVTNSSQLFASFQCQWNASCRQAEAAASSNLFPCSSVSTGNFFPAEKPCFSDGMMADLFERIAPVWAQSKMTMTLSSGKSDRKNEGVCAMITQNENEVCSAKVARHDQRASHSPVTRARRGRKWKNAVAFASVSGTAAVVAFRLRSSRLSACTSLFRSPNR